MFHKFYVWARLLAVIIYNTQYICSIDTQFQIFMSLALDSNSLNVKCFQEQWLGYLKTRLEIMSFSKEEIYQKSLLEEQETIDILPDKLS